MQMGTAVLHLYAEPGQKKKCIVALSCFEFQKKAQKKKKSEKPLYTPRH